MLREMLDSWIADRERPPTRDVIWDLWVTAVGEGREDAALCLLRAFDSFGWRDIFKQARACGQGACFKPRFTMAEMTAALRELYSPERLEEMVYSNSGLTQLFTSGRRSGKTASFLAAMEAEQRRLLDDHAHHLGQQLYRDVQRDVMLYGTGAVRDGRRVPPMDIVAFDESVDWDNVRVPHAPDIPPTPAAQLESLVAMVRAGLVSQEDALKLMDMPDDNHLADAAAYAYRAQYEYTDERGRPHRTPIPVPPGRSRPKRSRD